MKCIAIDRNRANCRNHKINDTEFCKLHQYLCEYTPEMLNNLTICSGCNKCYYLLDGRKTCDNCVNRGKKTREENKEEIILCGHIGCKFKKSSDNKYCLKHQLDIFLDSALEMGKKTCRNVIKGCRELLDADYEFSRCENCRIKEREADKKRRNKVTEIIESDTISYLIQEDGTEIRLRICSACFKDKPETEYKPERGTGLTKTCRDCRDQQKILDSRRDKEHRNEVARKNEAKPERKEVKREWAENNPEKVALITLNYRAKQLETNQEGYLSRNAENMKKWRERNPEKVEEIAIKQSKDPRKKYQTIKYNAMLRNYKFEISYDDYLKIANSPCYYCGDTNDSGFNGIDRITQTDDYVLESVVSCCSICNYMKGCLSKDVYLCRIEHILAYNKIRDIPIKIESYDLFPNHKSVSYNDYKNRANKKNLTFELTLDEFNSYIHNDCYICGKKFEEGIHTNGIDRIDNNEGYILSNIASCCSECNYMKKHFSFNTMMEKFSKTFDNHRNTIKPSHNNKIHSICKNKFKKSNEELKKDAVLRKMNKREKQREKYNSEEYKDEKMKELKFKKETELMRNIEP